MIKDKDDIFTQIDNTGVQRRVKKDVYNKLKKKHNLSDKNIIGALNGIEKMGRHIKEHERFVAKSGNYFIVFEGENVVTMFVTIKNGKINKNYFKENVLDKSVQRLKKWIII